MATTLYLNENIEVEVVQLLADKKINAVHTLHIGNQGKDDEYQLGFAASKGWVLLTHNRRDFRRLHGMWQLSGRNHSGIMLIGCVGPMRIVERVENFLLLYPHLLNSSFCETLP